jgi:hypothetical protein
VATGVFFPLPMTDTLSNAEMTYVSNIDLDELYNLGIQNFLFEVIWWLN